MKPSTILPRRIRTRRVWFATGPLLASLLLSGCTVVNVGSGERADLTAIGIVRVRVPVMAEGLVAVQRTGAGLGWDALPGGGAYLGWNDASWVIADPAKCQLLVIVRSVEQAANAQSILTKLKGEAPCIVDQSGVLRH